MADKAEQPLVPKEPDDFGRRRHQYLRLSSQAQTRLTVSTFLTGLTFAVFASLISSAAVLTQGMSLDQWLLVASAAVTSAATLLFLFATVSTIPALRLFADIAPSSAEKLTSGRPDRLDPRDVDRLDNAFNIYTRANHLISGGLILVAIALLLIGFRTSPYIGIVTGIALIGLLALMRPYLRFVLGGM